MALPHAHSGQIVDVQPFAEALASHSSCALLKGQQLELMRIVLPAGKSAPMHSVPGEVTVLCVEGSVDLDAHGRSQRMTAGQLVWLEGGVEHRLDAVTDASLLVTIQLAAAAAGD